MNIKTMDLGVQRDGDAEFYETRFQAPPCPHCDRPFNGCNRTDVALVVLSSSPFRDQADEEFLAGFRLHVEKHVRSHWWKRFVKWVKGLVS